MPLDDLDALMEAHGWLERERDDARLCSLIQVLDLMFAKWHGDKPTSKKAAGELRKILTRKK